MSDYIMDLRKIVGHRPLLQVGADPRTASQMGEKQTGTIKKQKT